MDKKIGVITMHKVLNYGSALQTYALQTVLENMGNKVQIIDYIYPNEYHKQYMPISKLRQCIHVISDLVKGRPYSKKVKFFNEFYKKYFKLTKTYYTKEELEQDPPECDVYMTGSDQVWNPNSIHEDTSFMLSFTDSPNKVAFSASFAKTIVPEKYKELYASELRKYKKIYMREKKGCELLKELTGVDSEVVLDPTLLLDKNKWIEFSKESKIKVKCPYILVYVLGYSFNVYPYVYELIKYVHRKTGLELVILNMNNKYAYKLTDKKIVKDADVFDFVKLFSDASLVITDSFHGTAFSLNLNTPFYSVVNEDDRADSRIVDLLTMTGEHERIVRKGSDYTKIPFSMTPPKIDVIERLRADSINKLEELIK